MAYVPRLFFKNGQTVLAEDPEMDFRLLWEGWTPGAAIPVQRGTVNATLADLDAMEARLLAAIQAGGGGTGGGGTNPYTVALDPADPEVGVLTLGVGAQYDPNDLGAVVLTLGANATLDPNDDNVVILTI